VPGIAQVVDARTQLEAELNRLRRGASGGDDALALLAQISPVLAGSTRYTLQAVDYRSGSLELTLSAGDVTTLDGVRESLAALPGLTVELSGVTPGKGVVEGRLRIRGGAR
jgi:type II secretory pathway component PulL